MTRGHSWRTIQSMAKCPNFTVTPHGTARGATDGMRCSADNNA